MFNVHPPMLFNSWAFLILLTVTFPLYYLPVSGMRRKLWQVTLLLTASAVFYAWQEPRLLLLWQTTLLLAQCPSTHLTRIRESAHIYVCGRQLNCQMAYFDRSRRWPCIKA